MSNKTFQNQCAQGDILIRRIGALPAKAEPITNETNRHIITHSETGHHHTITAPPSVLQLFGAGDPLVSYMRVDAKSVTLKHERSFDTHEPITITPGIYEVRRQREWSPEGWRRVED
jgi:hypothetical protein